MLKSEETRQRCPSWIKQIDCTDSAAESSKGPYEVALTRSPILTAPFTSSVALGKSL